MPNDRTHPITKMREAKKGKRKHRNYNKRQKRDTTHLPVTKETKRKKKKRKGVTTHPVTKEKKRKKRKGDTTHLL